MTRYYVWQGEVYPSVTSILQAIAKPALVQWAARRVAEAVVAEAEVIARLARLDPAGTVERLARAPWREKTDAGRVGTALHKGAEAIATGGRFEVTPTTEGLVRHFLGFVRERRPTFRLTEATVYSRQHRYAGTLDAIVTIGGQTVLLDYKTSKSIYPEYALQLAAYRHAEFIGLPDGQEVALPQIDACAVLHLTPTGYQLVEMDAGPATFGIFLAVRRLAAWLAEHAQGENGP
jgi:hypothetical protein